MHKIVSLHLETYNLLTLIIIQVQYYVNVIYNLEDRHTHTYQLHRQKQSQESRCMPENQCTWF